MTRWKTEIPTEEEEQMKLAEYLDMKGYCWFHCPNEGKHKPQYRAKQAKLGLKAGVPDIIILDVPEDDNCHRGVAIELKRKKGGKVTEEQNKWLGKLGCYHWIIKVAYGADEAIDWLEKLFKEG